MPQYRVVPSEDFERDMQKIGPKDERLAEVLFALHDALERNPLVGKIVRLNGDGIRMIRGDPRQGMPIFFYYYYDGGSTVTLHRRSPTQNVNPRARFKALASLGRALSGFKLTHYRRAQGSNCQVSNLRPKPMK